MAVVHIAAVRAAPLAAPSPGISAVSAAAAAGPAAASTQSEDCRAGQAGFVENSRRQDAVIVGAAKQMSLALLTNAKTCQDLSGRSSNSSILFVGCLEHKSRFSSTPPLHVQLGSVLGLHARTVQACYDAIVHTEFCQQSSISPISVCFTVI